MPLLQLSNNIAFLDFRHPIRYKSGIFLHRKNTETDDRNNQKFCPGIHTVQLRVVTEKNDDIILNAAKEVEINGVKFFYSDYSTQPGYNNAKSHGGVITGDGQHLKIHYVYLNETYGNIIVYIEEIAQ